MKKKIVVGITGASEQPLCSPVRRVLREQDGVELGVCISQTAPEVWALECGGDLREEVAAPVWGMRDYKAPFASGSAGWHAMVVVPCSMGTASRIAHGTSDTLLTRAADVMLKERRTLIVVPRESPLGLVHLENLTQLARLGALVLLGHAVVLRQAGHAERRHRHGGRPHPRPPGGRARAAASLGGSMSALVERALLATGLAPVLAARRAGEPLAPDLELLRQPLTCSRWELLADRVRTEEVGDEVRIYTEAPVEPDGAPRAVVLPVEAGKQTGLELLREVAIARITGPRAARVRVDWTRSGLELAQVALGFGADELVGHIADKRGLPLADGALLGVGKKSQLVSAQVVKRNELAGFVGRAGRTPRFVD